MFQRKNRLKNGFIRTITVRQMHFCIVGPKIKRITEWHEKDLAAMVRTDISHSSVIMYSIGNEVTETSPEPGIYKGSKNQGVGGRIWRQGNRIVGGMTWVSGKFMQTYPFAQKLGKHAFLPWKQLSIHDMLGSKLREANVVKEVWKQFRVGAIVVNCCMLAPGLLMVIWPGFLP